MVNVVQDKFLNIDFDASKSVFYMTWSKTTVKMTDESYMNSILILKNAFLKYKPKHLLTDLSPGVFGIRPLIQEWTRDNLFVHYEGIVEKAAFVMSNDIFTTLGAEQMVSNEKSRKFPTKFFGNRAEAEEWLFGL